MPKGRAAGEAAKMRKGNERRLLAPRNINDSNGDNELTWRSWGSRKQGTARRATAPFYTTAPAPTLRSRDHGRLQGRAGAASAARVPSLVRLLRTLGLGPRRGPRPRISAEASASPFIIDILSYLGPRTSDLGIIDILSYLG